jgi:hypothetical protein
MGVLAMALAGGTAQLPPESLAQLQEVEAQLAPSGITLTGLLRFFAIAVLVFGVLFLVTGVLVRRGGLGSIITSIILCCVVGLVAGASVIVGISGVARGQAQSLLPSCVWGGVLALLIFCVVSLIQAARNAGRLSTYAYPNPMQQAYGQQPSPYYPSQQPQAWQQPGAGPWQPPGWPPQQQQSQQPPPQQQNWPPPPPPSTPT